ncbi:MAG: hypothetical protein R3268_02765 [Acidiferrobacterales bacterium]|nr:hypothetical protein [Acidiferrobacterales bacterium]
MNRQRLISTAAAAFAILASACESVPLPATYSIAPQFDDAQAGAIRRAHGAWCTAVDYCPVEAPFPDSDLLWVTSGIVAETRRPITWGYQIESEVIDARTSAVTSAVRELVVVNSDHPAFPYHDRWATFAAHEIGHLCIYGHLPTGLMVRKNVAGMDGVDALAASAFVSGCDL